jgi:hypothetical protein
MTRRIRVSKAQAWKFPLTEDNGPIQLIVYLKLVFNM